MLEGDDAATGSGCGAKSRAIFPMLVEARWRWFAIGPSAFSGSGILEMITHTFYLLSELPNPAIATEHVVEI